MANRQKLSSRDAFTVSTRFLQVLFYTYLGGGSSAVRESEKARQFDRQREEIHPSPVLETLANLALPERESFRLPKGAPDPARDYSAQPLAIRYREKEVD